MLTLSDCLAIRNEPTLGPCPRPFDPMPPNQTRKYFGKAKEELKDWGRNDIVHPDDLPRVIEAWRKSVETGQNYEVEQRNRRADGICRWFQCRARLVRSADGEIPAWYWLLDIERPVDL